MKSRQIIFLWLLAISCTHNFDLTDHFDPTLPFEYIDVERPNSDGASREIPVEQQKHRQLVSWLQSNNHGWKKTEHNTHAALIIVTQGDFRILFYRDNDFVVVGYNDEENVMQQYMREMDSNELRFLVDD